MGNPRSGTQSGAGANRAQTSSASRRRDAAHSSTTRCCAPPVRGSRRGRLRLLARPRRGVHASWTTCVAHRARGRERSPDVVLRVFTDGRDTLPTREPARVQLSPGCRARGPRGDGHGPTTRWTAIGARSAADAYTPCSRRGRGTHCESGDARAGATTGETDEFVNDAEMGGGGRIRDCYSAVFFNFLDRARQLCEALDDMGLHLTTLTGTPRTPVSGAARPGSSVTLARCWRTRHAQRRGRDREVATDLFLPGGRNEHRARSSSSGLAPRRAAYDHNLIISLAQPRPPSWSVGRGGLRFGIINIRQPDVVATRG